MVLVYSSCRVQVEQGGTRAPSSHREFPGLIFFRILSCDTTALVLSSSVESRRLGTHLSLDMIW